MRADEQADVNERADERAILHELIYERVRAAVNLCQLVILEQDLEQSVARALERSEEETLSLARSFVDEAWQRVETEWRELRGQRDRR